jgi:hypothetical protein
MVWHREFGHLSLSVIRAYADRHKGRAITEHGRKVLHSFNARPRIRIRQDGFIRHDGGECPVPPWTRVEIEVEDDAGWRWKWQHGSQLAGGWVPAWWTRRHREGPRITAYRIVK